MTKNSYNSEKEEFNSLVNLSRKFYTLRKQKVIADRKDRTRKNFVNSRQKGSCKSQI